MGSEDVREECAPFDPRKPSHDERPRTVQIHPLSVVSPKSKIGQDVEIGPFCVVEDDVVLGDGCRLQARCSVKSGTVLGNNNIIGEGTVLGGFPQHLAVHDACGRLVIGNGNIFRENATVHRAMKEDSATEIGDNCMLMVNAHIAHDCRIGDNVVLTNNVMLAGHVSVGDRAILGGGAGVHQFTRIGKMAMVGGQAHVIQDVPPFMTVDGLTSRIVGLNQIGIRRSGYSIDDIKQLKAAYRMIFRSQMPWREMMKNLEANFSRGLALELIQFLASTTRGILSEGRAFHGKAVLKIHDAEGELENDDLSMLQPSLPSLKINAG